MHREFHRSFYLVVSEHVNMWLFPSCLIHASTLPVLQILVCLVVQVWELLSTCMGLTVDIASLMDPWDYICMYVPM